VSDHFNDLPVDDGHAGDPFHADDPAASAHAAGDGLADAVAGYASGPEDYAGGPAGHDSALGHDHGPSPAASDHSDGLVIGDRQIDGVTVDASSGWIVPDPSYVPPDPQDAHPIPESEHQVIHDLLVAHEQITDELWARLLHSVLGS
jgi:hypothetical protein